MLGWIAARRREAKRREEAKRINELIRRVGTKGSSKDSFKQRRQSLELEQGKKLPRKPQPKVETRLSRETEYINRVLEQKRRAKLYPTPTFSQPMAADKDGGWGEIDMAGASTAKWDEPTASFTAKVVNARSAASTPSPTHRGHGVGTACASTQASGSRSSGTAIPGANHSACTTRASAAGSSPPPQGVGLQARNGGSRTARSTAAANAAGLVTSRGAAPLSTCRSFYTSRGITPLSTTRNSSPAMAGQGWGGGSSAMQSQTARSSKPPVSPVPAPAQLSTSIQPSTLLSTVAQSLAPFTGGSGDRSGSVTAAAPAAPAVPISGSDSDSRTPRVPRGTAGAALSDAPFGPESAAAATVPPPDTPAATSAMAVRVGTPARTPSIRLPLLPDHPSRVSTASADTGDSPSSHNSARSALGAPSAESGSDAEHTHSVSGMVCASDAVAAAVGACAGSALESGVSGGVLPSGVLTMRGHVCGSGCEGASAASAEPSTPPRDAGFGAPSRDIEMEGSEPHQARPLGLTIDFLLTVGLRGNSPSVPARAQTDRFRPSMMRKEEAGLDGMAPKANFMASRPPRPSALTARRSGTDARGAPTKRMSTTYDATARQSWGRAISPTNDDDDDCDDRSPRGPFVSDTHRMRASFMGTRRWLLLRQMRDSSAPIIPDCLYGDDDGNCSDEDQATGAPVEERLDENTAKTMTEIDNAHAPGAASIERTEGEEYVQSMPMPKAPGAVAVGGAPAAAPAEAAASDPELSSVCPVPLPPPRPKAKSFTRAIGPLTWRRKRGLVYV